jgi:hypothetical protein
MSDSSLSPPPRSDINLPTLPPLSPTLQLRRTAKKPGLASTDSDLFTSGLFSRTLLETTPPTMQLRCLQPGCLYAPKPQLLSFNQTGNYWAHYYHVHPQVAEAFKPALQSSSSQSSQSHISSVAKLFAPRLSKPNAGATEAFQTKYRALLLDFVVSNNLALRVVDSQSHRRLIQHCNPTVLTISTSTLNRDLDQTFIVAQNALKAELQEHIKGGGRISITMNGWSTRNYKDFIAVTGHWINKAWKLRSQTLDIVHLEVSYIVTSY